MLDVNRSHEILARLRMLAAGMSRGRSATVTPIQLLPKNHFRNSHLDHSLSNCAYKRQNSKSSSTTADCLIITRSVISISSWNQQQRQKQLMYRTTSPCEGPQLEPIAKQDGPT
ncbi:hypothetical protein BO86DRAFT_224177 [Aspergillus japonicus CBS 114.51]|uniref:Uncharacterized protein n=1 Tax=Aspergillus japonicus CBS 114.51 TaxID=1448312 RepID=A0A8T8WNP8_ASPJA|nr:hypothetical protein BO86DRAFT_224177 [Aspergillus japonicus CBS 114.51]RAH77313.1 hypothetical protein BO86DRAFT_224177 [Aspergillus japonicus CBS 114.51]